MTVSPEALAHLDDVLAHVVSTRRNSSYRQRLLARTGIDSELTLRVLRALELASVHPEAPSIGDIAERLKLEHSSTSRAVNAAVIQGLVRKQRAKGDARRTELSPTAEGRAVIATLNASRIEDLGNATLGWSMREVGLLTDLLERLCAALGELDDTDGPATALPQKEPTS